VKSNNALPCLSFPLDFILLQLVEENAQQQYVQASFFRFLKLNWVYCQNIFYAAVAQQHFMFAAFWPIYSN